MNLTPVSALLLLSAVSSFVLGTVVFLRNPHKRTHQAFAVLTANQMLWALGVLVIIHTHEPEAARFWIEATFWVAAFLPATFYTFVCLFPHQRFQGSRVLLAVLWGLAGCVCASTQTSYYIVDLVVYPDAPPKVIYGPAFALYGLSTALSMVSSFLNLIQKLRQLSGVERRQVQHVILGVFLSTILATLTNILAPILDIHNLEAYGPNFSVLMVIVFAYAMVRYHLLDMWLIFSRTTVYAVLTTTIVLIYIGTVSLVQWITSGGGNAMNLGSIVLAALIIALILQPVKEHVQLFLDRAIVKRRYDMHGLLARISQNAAEMVKIDELLKTVAEDIQQTLGVPIFRVLLVDEKDPTALVIEHSSLPAEQGRRLYNHGALIKHMRRELEPLVLEKLLYERPSAPRTLIAGHLAAIDAFLCVPLKTSSGLVGLLTLGQKASRDIYSSDDLIIFKALAGPLGTAIENARLYRKLEEVNLHRARILSHMRGAVIAIDTDGKISTVNRAAKEMLGPMNIGQHYRTLVPELAEMLETTLNDQRAINDHEMMLTRHSGESYSIVVSSSCLRTANNETVGAMLMIYDLTTIKRLEQNVQRADRLSSLGTLAAGMAHEIKNPLVSIKTFTQLLLSRYDDPDFRATFSDVVPHEVERIDSIVMRLLDFARPKPPLFAHHDLRILIAEVLALVDNEVKRACIEIETRFADEYVEVYGDEQQLHQVFLNLILNAIDALKAAEGGVLRIEAGYGRATLGNPRFLPFRDVDCVRITFSDTGCGIPPETLQRIFTPFYTTKQHGSGLGLAVVHGIVTEHGGEIDVTSTPEEGTSFVVTLPLSRSTSSVEEV